MKWMKELPTSLWSFRLVPPAMRQSQKLMRLPRVTKGSNIVCFSPTVCAPPASSSRMQASLTCAPRPMFEPSRKTALRKKPPLSSTLLPSWQFSRVTGASAPRTDPAMMEVFAPEMRQPPWMVTPGAIISGSMSSETVIAKGFVIFTPLSMSALILSFTLCSMAPPERLLLADLFADHVRYPAAAELGLLPGGAFHHDPAHLLGA